MCSSMGSGLKSRLSSTYGLILNRGIFAAVFACLKPHFCAKKIFYDLRLDLRFVCYNGCELNDKDYTTASVA